MVVLQLTGAALLPVICSIIFYFLEKKTKFSKIPYVAQQIIIGVAFGIIACLGTQFGIPTEGVVLNVRGAAPLTAGLMFGGPAGIIAGVIGAVYRWVSIYWGVGSYSVIACSLGTFLAGLIGAGCRRFMFDNKKASAFYGLCISMTTEVIHLLLVFVTHMDDISTAFTIVRACALPMIIFNGLSVFISIGIVTVMSANKKKREKSNKRKITQSFSIALFISVIIAFSVTSIFTYGIQDGISKKNVNNMLENTIEDVEKDIRNASNENLLELTKDIAYDINNSIYFADFNLNNDIDEETRDLYRTELNWLAEYYEVEEINIIDKNGIILLSTYEDFDGFDMSGNTDGQAIEFMCLTQGTESYVQNYGPTDYNSSIMRKYAGVALDNGGFIQVGYGPEQFQNAIKKEVKLAAQNRHIEEKGFVMIIDEVEFNLISCPYMDAIKSEDIQKNRDLIEAQADNEVILISQSGQQYYYMQVHTEGYIIMGCYPVSEAHFYRDLGVYIGIFMQVLVFALLFVIIYFLIKKIIVNNLLKVNKSLAMIAEGHLDTVVDVRDNVEFSSLSDDINTTVDTLKHYIDDAEERVHKELEFAKTIQLSSLPSVFPPYPNKTEFDIYAMMTTAKEVGGDFYDFYYVGDNKFVILIADVSGKGVPAAMFMMTSKTMIKNLAETGMPVEEIMTMANEKLCEMNNAGMFVTVWMAMIDISTGKMSYVCAGHNPPLLKRSNGDFEYLKGRSGLVLAGMDGVNYRVNEVDLMPSDTIFLYTDGVTEATDNDEQLYGEDRLLTYLNANKNLDVTELCQGVQKDVEIFVGTAPQFDDITMLAFKLNKIDSYNSITLVPNNKSIAEVTSFVENWMLKTKVDSKIIKKVNIIVDEIYSNIVNYSGASWANIFYTRDVDNIYLSIKDDGVPYNPIEAKLPDITLSSEEREIGGLGIMMVKKMASDIEYSYTDDNNNLKIVISLN